MNLFSTILANIEGEIKKLWYGFLSVIGQIISAEENQLMQDAWPLVQKIAINLQNEQPGLDAASFISALIQAAVPELEKEGIKLVNTAVSILASTAAHQLNVPNTAGNAGNVNPTP